MKQLYWYRVKVRKDKTAYFIAATGDQAAIDKVSVTEFVNLKRGTLVNQAWVLKEPVDFYINPRFIESVNYYGQMGSVEIDNLADATKQAKP